MLRPLLHMDYHQNCLSRMKGARLSISESDKILQVSFHTEKREVILLQVRHSSNYIGLALLGGKLRDPPPPVLLTVQQHSLLELSLGLLVHKPCNDA